MNETGKTGQETVLVIDDDSNICDLIDTVLAEAGYQVEQAGSGREALMRLSLDKPDLICLDMYLPDINGLELLRAIRATPSWERIPVVVITVSNDRDLKLACLENGADDFLNKPIDYVELRSRINNLLRLKRYHELLTNYNANLEAQVKGKTEEIRRLCIDTVQTLTRAAEFRDDETGCHVARISHYAKELSQSIGMEHDFYDRIFHASPMHDIGKLAIPDRILLKQGQLSAAEWVIMRTHTTMGKEILRGHASSFLEMGREIAESHHECWDGSGYPYGLKGEAIPLAARVVTLCDVYDALRSQRPYKPSLSHEETVNVMLNGDERTNPAYFDPELLQRFAAISDRFADIYAESKRNQSFEIDYPQPGVAAWLGS